MKGKPRRKILLFTLMIAISFASVRTAGFVCEGGQVRAAEEEQSELLTKQVDTRPVYDEKTKSTVYSCIYFGSYPQTKVIGDNLTAAIENANYDENGDATVDGKKYHRVENIFGTSYFLYEPIKWKIVANVSGNIVAMAEDGLNYCSYYEAVEQQKESSNVNELTDEELENDTDRRQAYEAVSWEASTIRSWLNSYGEKQNLPKKSYEKYGQGFLSTAFSEEEQKDLAKSQDFSGSRLENYVTAIPGDRVFLLNQTGATHAKYGFSAKNGASPGRILEKTDYAAEKGREENDSFSDENAWWISSEVEGENKIQYVTKKGKLEADGEQSYHSMLVRPVIVIKGDSSNIKDAGKMSVSNEGGVSIRVQLQADKMVELNDTRTRYKDATISILVKNIGKEPIPAIDASLDFDDGTEILDGQNKVHFTNIEPGAEKNIAWRFAVKPQKDKRDAAYTIRFVGENLGETYIRNELRIPKLEKKLTEEAIQQIQKEQENRSFLEKMRDFFKNLA